MANNYTFQVVDRDNLVSASIEASINNCAQYVIALISRYIEWKGTIDFVVEIRPAAELTWSDADGLLPSITQVSWNGSAWVNDTLAECLTGFDSDPSRPDAGCTIYLADDGTIKNYGVPVWFDPNPVFGSDPAVPAGMHDFVGILTHEIFHSLGFIHFTKEWSDRIATQGGISYFTGTNAAALYGGPVPFQSGFDHYGYVQDPAIPISRGLMFQFGNYAQNRFDIGRIDLAILADLGHTVKTYDGLGLFEFIDTATGLAGSEAGETLYGDYHSNALSGLGGDDRIEGGSGDDLLRGDDGNDQLVGGAGNDVMLGGRGVDGFDGGGNEPFGPSSSFGDQVSFLDSAATQGAVADLHTGIISNDGFGNAESMTGIESLRGTGLGDFLGGDAAANRLVGEGGEDVIFGRGGDDIIEGGGGVDLLHGHEGDDSLSGGSGNDLLRGYA
ncbi:MAG TPA: calcium-binding protein, partial [Allosphingosinicella sp.]